MDHAVTSDEYMVLKNWSDIALGRVESCPMPASEIMQDLINYGFLAQLIRPEENSKVKFVVGYKVTFAGEMALKQNFIYEK